MPDDEPSLQGLERCRPFIDAVGDQVLVITRSYGVVMSNKAFLDQSGMTEDEVVGRRCHELTHRSPVPCCQRGEHCPLDRVLETGEPMRITHEHYDGNGGIKHVDIIGSPLRDSDGRMVAMVESLRDVTRQMQLEAELRLRNAELEEARRRRDEFTSTICHELRNVINVLGLNAAMLERTLSDDTENRRARVIIAESKRLTRLVGDLSDAAAIETQRFSLSRGLCELTTIVRDRTEAQQLSTDRHTIGVEAPEGPIAGNWDSERIGQVIDNLLCNAVKYSPDGGAILVVVARVEEGASVAITDQGIGIPSDWLPHLFEPYARAERAIGGLGLGLYVSRGIIEAHGGRIWATSAEQGGTTVAFTLPL